MLTKWTIDRKTSLLHNLSLLEKVSKGRLIKILRALEEEAAAAEAKNPHSRETLCANMELEKFTKYANSYNTNLGGVVVQYRKPKHMWGRAFPVNSIGLTSMKRSVRNTLIVGQYIDLDLINAQPSIVLALSMKNGEIANATALRNYCENREGVLQKICESYPKVNRKDAKDLFVRLCYGGTFSKWKQDVGIVDDDVGSSSGVKEVEALVEKFETEIKHVSEIAKRNNKALYETVRQKIKRENGKNSTANGGNNNNILGSFFAMYMQELESRIVENALKRLITKESNNNAVISQTSSSSFFLTGSYEFDGIKILKNGDEDEEKNIVEFLNEVTREFAFGEGKDDDGFRCDNIIMWASKKIDDDIMSGVVATFDEIKDECDDEDILLLQQQNQDAAMANYDIDEEFEKDMAELEDVIDNKDYGVVKYIQRVCEGHFVFSTAESNTGGCNKEGSVSGEWFGWTGKRWEKGDAPLREFIMGTLYEKHWLGGILDKWRDRYCMQKYIDTAKAQLNLTKKSSSIGGLLKKGGGDGSSSFVFKEEDEEDQKKLGEIVKSLIPPDVNPVYMNKFDAVDAKAFSRSRELKKAAGVNCCVTVAKTILRSDTVCFDTNPHLIGFNNGIIDLEEGGVFRPPRFSDYVTMSCGWDFTPSTSSTAEDEDARMFLEGIFRQIFPDEALRDYFFKIVSTGLSGIPIEKFFIFNGNGRNGKGLITEFLQKVFGNYFAVLDPKFFTEDQSRKTVGSANPEVANLDRKRYVVAKEPERDAKLQNSVIKAVTGGGTINARFLYSSKTTVRLCLTCIMECNDKPLFSEEPKDADVERINDVLFASKFTIEQDEWDANTGETNHIYPVDSSLKSILITGDQSKVYWNAMVNMLLPHILQIKSQNFNIDVFRPESVRDRSLAYLQKSFGIHSIFVELFKPVVTTATEKTADYPPPIRLMDVARKISESPSFSEMLGWRKAKDTPLSKIAEFFKTNAIYKKNVEYNKKKHTYLLNGWRLKLPNETDDEEEDDIHDLVDID